MASARRVVTVDLGTSTIKFGEFSVGRNGALTLLRFDVAELGLDPNKEEDRGRFITPTLAKLFKDNKVKGRDVLLALSSQSVFTRFVKLPPVDAAQVGKVVAFEAQQNVPFPINEVTWDYQMMPNRAAGADPEAVIVAIKKDVVEAELTAVENAGVKVKQVDVAPFALLNAFRYSEPQTDDCSLIIDMGARSTNLIFLEKTTFWIRNVPIAGNQISQSICNELQEPFVAAETLKKGKGFVSLGGVYADPDDADTARISKLIRSSMTRLHVDINRSIAHYRTTLGGGAPKRVFLAGGSSQLPYLDLFIADKLSLPVAFFNPLRNVNLAPSVDMGKLQEGNCYTAELVGLALRETGSCPAEINLEAPTLAARASKKFKRPYYYAALFAWALIFVVLNLFYYQQTVIAQNTTEALKEQAQRLEPLVAPMKQLVDQLDTVKNTIDPLVRLGKQRDAWPSILSALNDKIPEGVWITELTPGSDEPANGGPGGGPFNQRRGSGAGEGNGDATTILLISGLYHDFAKTEQVDPQRLSDFVSDLSQLPQFDINTHKMSDTLVSFTTDSTDPNSLAQKFSMKLRLKQPISQHP